MTEFNEAISLANFILDRPNADPDDNEAILSRQFLRLKERADSYWLALTLIKNHGSHDQAVLREIARGAVADD